MLLYSYRKDLCVKYRKVVLGTNKLNKLLHTMNYEVNCYCNCEIPAVTYTTILLLLNSMRPPHF